MAMHDNMVKNNIGKITTEGNQWYASSKEEGERVIKRSLSNSILST